MCAYFYSNFVRRPFERLFNWIISSAKQIYFVLIGNKYKFYIQISLFCVCEMNWHCNWPYRCIAAFDSAYDFIFFHILLLLYSSKTNNFLQSIWINDFIWIIVCINHKWPQQPYRQTQRNMLNWILLIDYSNKHYHKKKRIWLCLFGWCSSDIVLTMGRMHCFRCGGRWSVDGWCGVQEGVAAANFVSNTNR